MANNKQTTNKQQHTKKDKKLRSEELLNTIDTQNGELFGEAEVVPLARQPDPLKKIMGDALVAWNDLAAANGLPQVLKLTKGREAPFRQRLKEVGLEGWKTAISKISGNAGLLGDNNRGWKANFDFVIRETNFNKLCEGAYDNWKSGSNGGTQQLSELERAILAVDTTDGDYRPAYLRKPME